VDTNGGLARALMEKKIDNAYERFIKRQDKEKLTYYFNQDLNPLALNDASTTFDISTIGTTQRKKNFQRNTCAAINELSKSLS
jgi:hypothetical protein